VAPSPGRRIAPEGEHLRLGLIDVVDHDVDMELLREGRVGPARRLVVGGVLEAQADGPAVADIDPVPIHPGDRQAQQLRIEPRQRPRIWTVEHHTSQSTDHLRSFLSRDLGGMVPDRCDSPAP
jgi:hypothetical protein